MHRALSSNEHGYVYGYIACIPGINLKKYSRVTKKNSGKAGLFKQFLRLFPEIKQSLEDMALGKVRIDESKVRGHYYKRIWKVFKELCKEQGIDATFVNWRGIFANPGVESNVVEYWTEAMKEMVKTKSWKEALVRNGWDDNFMVGEEFVSFLAKQEEDSKGILEEIGMLKN